MDRKTDDVIKPAVARGIGQDVGHGPDKRECCAFSGCEHQHRYVQPHEDGRGGQPHVVIPFRDRMPYYLHDECYDVAQVEWAGTL